MKLAFVFTLCFFSLSLYGQDTTVVVKLKKFELTSSLDRLDNSAKNVSQSILKQRSIFDVKKLPIFCKIEHKLAKSSNVNVMMRLGSLDYVNKLEGKTP